MVEQWRLREAYKSFVIRTATIVESSPNTTLPGSLSYQPRPGLHARSYLPEFADIVICHPRTCRTISEFEEEWGFCLRYPLEYLHEHRLWMGRIEAAQAVAQNENLEIWGRMAFADQFGEDSRVGYIGVWRASFPIPNQLMRGGIDTLLQNLRGKGRSALDLW